MAPPLKLLRMTRSENFLASLSNRMFSELTNSVQSVFHTDWISIFTSKLGEENLLFSVCGARAFFI